MSLNALEREVVISFNDGEDFAEVYSASRPTITKLRKNPAAELIEEGTHEGSAWAKFRIAKNLISFRSTRRTGGSGNPAALAKARASSNTAVLVENVDSSAEILTATPNRGST